MDELSIFIEKARVAAAEADFNSYYGGSYESEEEQENTEEQE